MATAKSLVGFWSTKSNSKEKVKGKSGGDSGPHETDGNKSKSFNKDKVGSSKQGRKERGPLKCFLRNSLRMAWECPSKAKLATLVKEEEEKEGTWLGLLWILSSIQKKEHKAKGMMCVDIEVVGKWLEALVDMGASNQFVQPISQEAWDHGGEGEEDMAQNCEL